MKSFRPEERGCEDGSWASGSYEDERGDETKDGRKSGRAYKRRDERRGGRTDEMRDRRRGGMRDGTRDRRRGGMRDGTRDRSIDDRVAEKGRLKGSVERRVGERARD